MNDYNKKTIEKASSIDQLATLICGYGYFAYHNDDRDHPIPKAAIREYLEMGVSFARQKMIKDAIDATVHKVGKNYLKEMDLDKISTTLEQYENGDKVKVIIIKEV